MHEGRREAICLKGWRRGAEADRETGGIKHGPVRAITARTREKKVGG